MSTKGNLTRPEAVATVGEQAVNAVERENCDFTNRVLPDNDTRVEFAASVQCTDASGVDCTLVAYYYQEQADIDGVEGLDALQWDIAGYEIV